MSHTEEAILCNALKYKNRFSQTNTDANKFISIFSTKLKLTGDMKVSFPAGIVKVLMDNPSPQPLSFRVKNTSTFEYILVNKQLIQQ